MATTYAQLRDKTWGVRSTEVLEPGQRVTVTKKSGERKTETINRIVWTGNGIWLASVVAQRSESSRPRRRNWQPCGYPGCNPNYCDECDGEGYRPGR